MSKQINEKPISGICPACGSSMRLRQELRVGDFVTCMECDTELEVLSLKPLKLDWAYEEPFDDNDTDQDDWRFSDDEDYEYYPDAEEW
jgi:lysine biosynthesis protein LysW